MAFEPRINTQNRRQDGLRYARSEAIRKKSKARRVHKNDADGSELALKVGRLGLMLFGKSMRMILMIVATLTALTAVSGVMVAGYLYISKSDYFAVQKVVISGINHIDREEIIRAAVLDQPANILTFDVEEATREISALPWLAEVKVARQMPDTVTIDVTEHNPRLLVNLGRLYYMNDKGEPFKELAPGENPDLPIVTGFNEDDMLSPGPGVRAALEEVFWLADALSQRNDEFSINNISEINYDMVRGLTLFTRNSGLEVKIGFGAYEEKFRRLGRVMAHLKIRGKLDGLVYLNLEASPRVTVRYAGNSMSASRRDT